jgi:hypothetical protein
MHLLVIIAALSSVFRLDSSFAKSAMSQVEAPQLLKAKCQLHESFTDCDGKTWFNPEGTLHLFEVLGDSAAIRMDKSIHHGTTYGRLLFCHDDKIFMFGGYGMFIFQTALIYFDKNNQEWFDQKIEGLPNNRVNSYATQYGDSLIVFTKSDIENKIIDLGVVDLNTFKYQKVREINAEGFFMKDFTLRGTQIDYLESNLPISLIFDKKELKFYHPNFSFLVPSHDFGASGITLDEVFAESLDASTNLIVKKFSYADYKTRFPEYTLEPTSKYTWLWIMLALLALAAISAYVIKRTKATPTSDESLPEANLTATLVELKKHNNQLIDAQKLQSLLNLNYDNPDTMRVKMNAKIRAINADFPGAIERIKSSEDSRLVSYQITIK